MGVTPPTRRGVALLLVLAVLVVVVAGVPTIVQDAAALRLERRVSHEGTLLRDVLTQSERAAMQWLQEHSSAVVLPPEVHSPRIEILSETIDAEGQPVIDVHLTAFDQCGMAPWPLLAAGSPLRLALPTDVIAIVDGTSIASGTVAGLDLVVPEAGRHVFPRLDDEVPVFGGVVATHNAPPRINVNTAPLPLLEQALRMAGRGGLDVIAQRREEGVPSPAASAPSGRRSDSPDDQIEVVGQSTAWAIRMDVRVGLALQSWWTVFINDSGTWKCAQRILIDA